MAFIQTIENSSRADLLRRAMSLQWLTVAHGLLEGFGALTASHGSNSVALFGFGLDAIVEVMSASIVLWRLKSLNRGGRFGLSELAGLRLVGAGFLVLAISLLIDATRSLLFHEVPHESLLGLGVTGISVLLMPILGQIKKRVGLDLASPSMQADSKQTHFCAYLAGITLVGVACNSGLGWWWADSVAALCMVPIIGWEAIQTLRGRACGCCQI